MKRNHPVMQTILRTAIHFPWLTVGIILTVLGSVVLSLIPPLVLGKIIDLLTAENPVSFSLILGYFLLIVCSGILDSSRESLLTVFGQKITHALRSRLSEKLACLSADSLTQQNPGVLTERFMGDVNTVELLFTSGIISMVTDICKIISILVVIWTKTTGLALILTAALPMVFLFTRAVQKRMLHAQLENRQAISRASGHIPESLRCIRTIHNLQKESYMEDRYGTYIGQSYRAIEKNNFYDSVYSPVILIFNAVITAAVMLLSASGNPKILTFFGMSVGTAVAVINYIAQVFSPLESLGMEIQTIQSAVAGTERINEFLSRPERIKGTAAGSANVCGVELHHVTFGYEADRIVLDNVSFRVKPGERVTISGRTGAGKSTIFKLLLGLYAPQSGKVLVNGVDAASLADSQKRRIFGYVDQTFHMVPGTVRDQITLSDPSITDDMVLAAAKLTGLHDTICHLEQGYDTRCTPSLFSQGQWQLLSIARAVAAEPEILLLDEITANLDADTEQKVLDAIDAASENRTVISISHRIYRHTGGRVIEIP